MSRACLVIGGARSGKSAYAQGLAESSGLSPTYVATAGVWDDEMGARIRLHRAARDTRWRTLEEQLELADTLVHAARPGEIVVVDCLTLWLTNVMLGDRDADAETNRLRQVIGRLTGPVIFVSNEVGQGIVPDNRLARDFRDQQGRLNQAMASACDTVVLVTAGVPLLLKPAARPQLAFS